MKKGLLKEEIYKTADISMAGYLLSKKHELLGVEKSGGRGFFIFSDEKVKNDVFRYLNGGAVVEPFSFLSQIRKLKGALV
jgi:hypothetical protein